MSEKRNLIVKKYFRLFDFNVYDDGSYASDKTFVIQMFGVDEKGKKLCAYVDDYKPFFYIKAHDDWTNKDMELWVRTLDEKYRNYIIKKKLVEHHKLYGFSGGRKHKFVRLEFENTSAMSQFKNLWFTKNKYDERVRENLIHNGVELELYESNIPPLLRYFHVNEIAPSGWISYKSNKVIKAKEGEKKTSCDHEITCSYKSIVPEPTKETIVPFNICSFDIEASSSHGDFPLPKKTYKRLASNIVDIFIKQRKYSNSELMSPIFRRCIMKAFGYDNIDEDIDVVYPKKPIKKDDLEKIIHLYLQVPMNKICPDNDEAMQELLSIQDMFEEVHSQKEQESNTMDSDVQGNQEIDEGNVQSWKKKFGYKKNKVKGNVNIVEYLLEDSHTREEQLNALDLLLLSKLPPLEGDKVTFIGSTFMNYGEKEPNKNHCIVLGDCDEVKGAEIVCVDNEKQVLLEWTKVIQRENPDIIIGYNIFGFDYEFMFQRSKETGCVSEFLKLSRDRDHISKKDTKGFESDIQIMNTKVMLASGEYDLRYYNMLGRLQIDMYTYFRRDFNLSSYKLDDVAGQFINDSIKKVECTTDANGNDITKLYSKNLMGLHVDDFIHIELSSFTSDYFKDGKKFKVVDIEYNVEVEEKGKTNKYNVIVIDDHQDIDKSKKLNWGMAKDDVTPQDIFRLADEGPRGRAIVAKYCIQDCNLVHHLMNKIDVITGYMEMANICSVPISFLVFRGQGIKLTSYVAKKCREKDTLMPDLEKPRFASGYEGAIVLPPKCKMYMDNPVACVDYSSLYPSSMISQNYSHDSKVWSKEFDLDGNLIPEKTKGEQDENGKFIYDELPGYQYIDIEFDTFEYRRSTPTSRAEKIKVGSKKCRWAQLPDNQKSIMPSILEELLKARKDTRKMIKTEKDPFMQNILDKRQLGYKVTANSLYGQCGARTSTFYEQDVAASTTATGRMMIIYGRRMIEEVYGDRVYESAIHGPVKCNAEYVYGDSVAEYTPVYARIDGIEELCTISQLAAKYGNNNWVQCKEEGKQTKEFCELQNHVETWTEKGWTRLYRVIRHTLASHKNMVRVLTHTGVVDVTDDHSLLLPDASEISPKDIHVGDELLHHPMPLVSEVSDKFTVKQARIMGFFFGDGSCGSYECASSTKHTWALNNASLDLLNEYEQLCIEAYPELDWTIMDTLDSSGVYKLSPRGKAYGDICRFVEMYRDLMYSNKSKIIPNNIMRSSKEVRQAFWDGMYDADGDKDQHGYVRIDQKSQLSASHICWLANSLDWKTSLNTRDDKSDIYRVTMTKSTQRKHPHKIKKMYNIHYDGFVYDLTTENHHFAAGVGNLIVHNTDSVFFTFNLENPETGEKIRGKPALEATIEIAQDAADLCTRYLKPPMKLEYEKTLMPFILLSKKRYVGILYEEDPNVGYLKFMGLSLKRRDSCDYLKDVYGGILNILMKEGGSNNLRDAIEYLNQSLMNLIDGKVSMDKLTITKALRSDYKNPQQIAHRVLADRIGERDPGNKPRPGDRMRFVFVVNDKPKALQGDKIETPDYIIDNKVSIDYTHYITNQLMKPLQQLFGLAVEDIWTMQKKMSAIKMYRKDVAKLEDECGGDLELFMKKREKVSSAKIKVLLFDKILQMIYNRKNRIQTLDAFFKSTNKK